LAQSLIRVIAFDRYIWLLIVGSTGEWTMRWLNAIEVMKSVLWLAR